MRFSRFIIGLTTSIAFSVQAAVLTEAIKQLPAGANLALMVQKIGAPAPAIDYHSQQMALPPVPKGDYRAGSSSTRPGFPFTTTLETKGNVDSGILKVTIARFGGDPALRRPGYSQYGRDAEEKSPASRKSTLCAYRYVDFRQHPR